MRRFLILIAVAVLATLPAVLFRGLGLRPSPIMDAAIFGVAILAAGFLLSWGAEAAEQHISQGLILAIVALQCCPNTPSTFIMPFRRDAPARNRNTSTTPPPI